LALSSGSARGLAHIGVLETLEKEGIPIDMIAGTSMGAVIGASYAAGKNIDQMKEAVIGLKRRRILSLVDFTLPRTGFIKGKRMHGWLRSIIGNSDFKDLRIPFACIATDIMSGEEVIINQGSVVEGVRASVSMPVIFTPAKWQGRYLVDGGLVNPMPVRVLREMGADFVIAVNVNPYISKRTLDTSTEQTKAGKAPHIFSILMRTINIMEYQAALAGLKQADITINPKVGHIIPGQFHRARECILRGQRATQHAIPEIKRQLEI